MQVCTKGIWDETIPGIRFNNFGVSNYCELQEKMMADYPRGDLGSAQWTKILEQVRERGKGKKYDCIVGVSGGVDSSYLLYLCTINKLRVLAVHLDNGFNSEISVDNIHKITTDLGIDLKTYVIDYEEIKDILRSYMKAGMPWIDAPTDLAIKATMYRLAQEENVKYIFRGNDFRSEGKQPKEWTYSDERQLRYIQRNYGLVRRIRSYPYLGIMGQVYAGFVKGIKDVRPYYYLSYNKEEAKQLLAEKFGWRDYGGHHHENLFTKFAMAYWLPRKFGIDKRKINLSAQVLSGAISREKALEEVARPFDTEENLNDLKNYVLKKLDLTVSEFESIWQARNHNYSDFPSNYNLIYKNIRHFKWLIRRIFAYNPMSIDSNEMIK